jgi:hypothetical protein
MKKYKIEIKCESKWNDDMIAAYCILQLKMLHNKTVDIKEIKE